MKTKVKMPGIRKPPVDVAPKVRLVDPKEVKPKAAPQAPKQANDTN